MRFGDRFNGFLKRVNDRLARFEGWRTLHYLEKLGVLAAVALFFWNVRVNNERKLDERVQKHLQAWQTINLGRTGDWSGSADGRMEALESLLEDKVSLDFIDLTMAWLVGADLRRASLRGASFDRAALDLADMRGADVTGARFGVRSATGLNIHGIRGLTPEQRRELVAIGAVEIRVDREWERFRATQLSDSSIWRGMRRQ